MSPLAKFRTNTCNSGRVIAANVNFIIVATPSWILSDVNFDDETASRNSFSASVSNLEQIYAIVAEVLTWLLQAESLITHVASGG